MAHSSPSRLSWIVLAIIVGSVLIVVSSCEESRNRLAPLPTVRLAERIAEFTGSLLPDGPYREPTVREQLVAQEGSALLLQRGGGLRPASRQFAKLGFAVTYGRDSATGRPLAMLLNQPHSARSWGMYIVDLSAPIRRAIEVPHPNSDLRTEKTGLSLFRRAPGSVLLIAGAHRDAADGTADVAHNADSVFHVVAAEFAKRGLPQVQLHGFSERDLPWQDVVLSSGIGDYGELAERAVQTLEQAGISVCVPAWNDCGPLAGTENVQGKTAVEHGSPFLHVEIRRSVREADEQRSAVVEGLINALCPCPVAPL